MDSQGDGESQESSAEGDGESQQPLMDILKAALVGDVSLLRKAYEDNVGDLESYFLGRTVKEMMSYPPNHLRECDYRGHSYCNILHAAVLYGQYSFLCEALEILKSHPTLIIHLICQTVDGGYNCLHFAVRKGNIYVVKLLVHAYVTAVASADNSEFDCIGDYLDCKEDERADDFMNFEHNTIIYEGQTNQPIHTQSGLHMLMNMACYEGDGAYEPRLNTKRSRRTCGVEIVASLLLADINNHRLKLLKHLSKLEPTKQDVLANLLETRKEEKKKTIVAGKRKPTPNK